MLRAGCQCTARCGPPALSAAHGPAQKSTQGVAAHRGVSSVGSSRHNAGVESFTMQHYCCCCCLKASKHTAVTHTVQDTPKETSSCQTVHPSQPSPCRVGMLLTWQRCLRLHLPATAAQASAGGCLSSQADGLRSTCSTHGQQHSRTHTPYASQPKSCWEEPHTHPHTDST